MHSAKLTNPVFCIGTLNQTTFFCLVVGLLADCAITRAMEVDGERLTESGIAVGTTEYMSLEQAAADKIDQRSDLGSLACVLYELLAGVPPYTGASAQAVRARHARDVMPSLQTVRPTVSSRLDGVVAKALAKVPADLSRFTHHQQRLRSCSATGLRC